MRFFPVIRLNTRLCLKESFCCEFGKNAIRDSILKWDYQMLLYSELSRYFDAFYLRAKIVS